MAKPYIHADSTVKKFGGKAEDYMAIHEFLDSSKAYFPDVRHRALTHNSFFIEVVIPRIFGRTIINSDGKECSTQEIAEQHVLEDFKKRFIPTPQDWLENIEMHEWMNNGLGKAPNSALKLEKYIKGRFNNQMPRSESKHPSLVD